MYIGNGFVEALRDFPAWASEPGANRTEYLENPHMYWTVVMMDLGILVPAAIATGVALLKGGTDWATRAMYVVVGWLALVGPAVAAMGIAMEVNDDPAASLGKTVMFCVAAAVFVGFAARLYWPAIRGPRTTRTRRARGGFGRLAGA
jgi:hypothetical protein